jgi:hypothetical protein
VRLAQSWRLFEGFVRAANADRAELIAVAWLGRPESVFWQIVDDVNEEDIELFHFAQQEICERTDPDPTCKRIVDLLGKSIFIDRAYRHGYGVHGCSQGEQDELKKLRSKVSKKLAEQQAADAALFVRFPKVSGRAAVRQLVATASLNDIQCLRAASGDALQRLGMDYSCRTYYLYQYLHERLEHLKSGLTKPTKPAKPARKSAKRKTA